MLRPMPLCFFNVTVTTSGSFLIGYGESKEQRVELRAEKTEADGTSASCPGSQAPSRWMLLAPDAEGGE